MQQHETVNKLVQLNEKKQQIEMDIERVRNEMRRKSINKHVRVQIMQLTKNEQEKINRKQQEVDNLKELLIQKGEELKQKDGNNKVLRDQLKTKEKEINSLRQKLREYSKKIIQNGQEVL